MEKLFNTKIDGKKQDAIETAKVLKETMSRKDWDSLLKESLKRL